VLLESRASPLGLLFSRWKLNFQRHSNQFCQRLRLHLPHHVAAMNLHGDLADTELKSYLFIEHTRNHQAHDFALALAQGLVAMSQRGKVTALTACRAVAIQSLVDRIQQVLVFEGFSQKLHSTRFHGPHRHRNISMTGDENDGNVDSCICQLALQVETVDSGKAHVQNKTAWSVQWFVAQKFFRRPNGYAP